MQQEAEEAACVGRGFGLSAAENATMADADAVAGAKAEL